MSLSKNSQVAVLGLGIIGSRACLRLIDAAWQVTCWNRTPKGFRGEVAIPEDAVHGAGIVSIYLKDAHAVREVVARIQSFLKPGQIILNHATVDLQTTLWLENLCLAHGCRFLDAPFTGSKVASVNGDLVYYTGGNEDLTRELMPYLRVTSKSQLHTGAVGTATVTKLATNLISACTVQALAEALAIATRHGVSAGSLIDAVSLNASASLLAGMKLPTMAAGNFETHFSLANMGKDSRYMLALAESAGVETPAIAAVSKRMEELSALGLGDLDYSAVSQPYLSRK